MNQSKRWRGLVALVADTVSHGASAIERIHLEQSEKPFKILEEFPEIAGTTKMVHAVHDAIVKSSYASVRLVTKAVAATLDVVIEAVDKPEVETTPRPPGE
jgi:hypothetical protein